MENEAIKCNSYILHAEPNQLAVGNKIMVSRGSPIVVLGNYLKKAQ